MILTKTPYRIALSGGGTDLEFYYKKRGCSLLTMAINQYVYVYLSPRIMDNNYLIQTSDTHFATSVKDIRHKLIRETLKYYKVKEKVHIGTYSTIPTRTGLGTSSATLIGLIKCILEFKKIKMPNIQIIKDAYKIERKICGYKGGWQDQVISQVGGFLKLEISRKEKIFYKKIKISKKIEKIVNNHLLLIYTKKKRESSKVIDSQKNDVNTLNLYDSIKELNRDLSYSLKKQDYKNLANIFNVHWSLKKKISNMISSPDINNLYKKLINKYNCLGGKLIGAGGGGFFLMVVKDKNKVVKKLQKDKISYLNLKPDSRGTRVIDINENKI